MWGITRYQWTVLFAAWLGWGFDIFDSILFNYVAPNCIPSLLHLAPGSPEARAATLWWGALITALLLVGWAAGGVLFGQVCDRLGRLRTLMLTMGLYALGTAACAFAPNLGTLIACRVVASLGIGGEWAAGAAMVAEAMPERRRVEAGALLYTAAPFGLFLATWLNYQVAGVWFPDDPGRSWRALFLFGLLPAGVAFAVRFFLHEPERWQTAAQRNRARLADLFRPAFRGTTLRGTFVVLVALATWWTLNAFTPTLATMLARDEAARTGLDARQALALVERWKVIAMVAFNTGGLVGTLLAIPLGRRVGRRRMFAGYFIASALAIFLTFWPDWPPVARLVMFLAIGVPVFGVFGAFPYYLPELFPTWLRATGAGFCYNIGRLLAAGGVFLVGAAAARGLVLPVLCAVALVPLAGALLARLIPETRGRPLVD